MPCGMDYDLVIKFENLERDSNHIIQQCGLQHKLKYDDGWMDGYIHKFRGMCKKMVKKIERD